MLLYVLRQIVWLVCAIATTDLALIAAVISLLLIVGTTAVIYLLAPTDDRVRHGPSTFNTHRGHTPPVGPEPEGRHQKKNLPTPLRKNPPPQKPPAWARQPGRSH